MKEEVEKLRRDNEALTNNNNDTEAALDTTKTKLDNVSGISFPPPLNFSPGFSAVAESHPRLDSKAVVDRF